MPRSYQHNSKLPAKARRAGSLLYLLASPLLIKLGFAVAFLNLSKALAAGGSLFLFYSAAHLTRHTALSIAADARRVVPQKIKDYRGLAGFMVGLGVLVLALFLLRYSLRGALMLSGFAVFGYFLVYGLPQKQQSPTADIKHIPEATREAIKTAYADLAEITSLRDRLTGAADELIVERLDKVLEQSHNIMCLLVKSPEDAGKARRFLHVYVHRIKAILQQYLRLSTYGKADKFRQQLSTVLAETYQVLSQREAILLDDDAMQLDVQLAVFGEQIRHEEKS